MPQAGSTPRTVPDWWRTIAPRSIVPKVMTSPSTVRPITTSYEIICEPARRPPRSENLFADDQPASIAPITVRPLKANTISRPASSCAICIGYVRSPNQSASGGTRRPGSSVPPNGITANTSSTGVKTTQGAIA